MAKKETPEKVAEEKTAMAVPEYMKSFLAQAQKDTDSLISSSMSVPRVSYRGGRFRFIENGEEEVVNELTIKVVILGVEPDAGLFIKTFYASAYTPGSSEAPDCSSSDGIRPDMWVGNPQAPLCGQCSKNVFGSAVSRTGGKAKACKEGKRLWIAKPSDPTHYYGLNVPIMSMKNLAEYGKYIAKNGYPLSLVVTEIGLEADAEFPQLTFNHIGFVREASVEPIVKINNERPWCVPQSARPAQLPPQASVPVQESKQPEPPKKSVEEALGEW